MGDPSLPVHPIILTVISSRGLKLSQTKIKQLALCQNCKQIRNTKTAMTSCSSLETLINVVCKSQFATYMPYGFNRNKTTIISVYYVAI